MLECAEIHLLLRGTRIKENAHSNRNSSYLLQVGAKSRAKSSPGKEARDKPKEGFAQEATFASWRWSRQLRL